MRRLIHDSERDGIAVHVRAGERERERIAGLDAPRAGVPHRRIVHRRDGQADGRGVGVFLAVMDTKGEAVRAVVVRCGRVSQIRSGAAERAICRRRDDSPGERIVLCIRRHQRYPVRRILIQSEGLILSDRRDIESLHRDAHRERPRSHEAIAHRVGERVRPRVARFAGVGSRGAVHRQQAVRGRGGLNGQFVAVGIAHRQHDERGLRRLRAQAHPVAGGRIVLRRHVQRHRGVRRVHRAVIDAEGECIRAAEVRHRRVGQPRRDAGERAVLRRRDDGVGQSRGGQRVARELLWLAAGEEPPAVRRQRQRLRLRDRRGEAPLLQHRARPAHADDLVTLVAEEKNRIRRAVVRHVAQIGGHTRRGDARIHIAQHRAHAGLRIHRVDIPSAARGLLHYIIEHVAPGVVAEGLDAEIQQAPHRRGPRHIAGRRAVQRRRARRDGHDADALEVVLLSNGVGGAIHPRDALRVHESRLGNGAHQRAVRGVFVAVARAA